MSLSLGPRASERPADAGFTFVGTLDDERPARVDQAGLVQPHDASWSIDWWIGADDRWYFPSREASVRQRRLGAGPLIETAMRIPSGDALHRCYPVSIGGTTATVIEVENDSPVPVALALAVRPYRLDGSPSHGAVAISDNAVRVAGVVALSLPRRANERLATNRDVSEIVEEGQALSGAAEASGERPNAVVLYPLPHRTKLRFVVPSDGQPVSVSAVPEVDAVERGWTSVVEGGGRFVLPDNGLSDRAGAARARLLIANGQLAANIATVVEGAGDVLRALVESGAGTMGSGEAVRLPLLALASAFPGRVKSRARAAADIVAASGRAVATLNDVALAEELLDVLAHLTKQVERSKDIAASAVALDGLGWALLAAKQPEAARQLFERASDLGPAVDLTVRLDKVVALSEQGTAAGSWGADDVGMAARFWSGVRSLAVIERPDGLDLLPEFPTAWRGGNVEVHQASTAHGLVSFAIRWHGFRPALLWDLDLHRPVEVRCPALDPVWSTTEAKGEALLAGVGEELPPPPGEGQSFV